MLVTVETKLNNKNSLNYSAIAYKICKCLLISEFSIKDPWRPLISKETIFSFLKNKNCTFGEQFGE